MLKFKALHHVSVRYHEEAASRRFYCDVLGFAANPEKPNWLGWPGADHQVVHLMPAVGLTNVGVGGMEDRRDLAKHLAFEVEQLEPVVEALLAHGFKPFQSGLSANERKDIASAQEPLDFGIGTVFVLDPGGNVVEFIQRDRGIFAKLPA